MQIYPYVCLSKLSILYLANGIPALAGGIPGFITWNRIYCEKILH